MSDKFYDTGYDYVNKDVYVGVGGDRPLYRDAPFFAQYDFIRDWQKGEINLSARSTLIHGASTTSMVLGAHYASTKGILDPALFSLRYAQMHISHAARAHLAFAAGRTVQTIARWSPYAMAAAFAAGVGYGLNSLYICSWKNCTNYSQVVTLCNGSCFCCGRWLWAK